MSPRSSRDAAPISSARPSRPRLSYQEAELAASMEAFDQCEHERRVAENDAAQRARARVARDVTQPLVERVEAAIAGLGLRRVLWASVTPQGAVVHACDGKHVDANRRAIARLVEVLPRVGLVGAVAGQDVTVTAAPGRRPSTPPPSSGRRPLLAGDREYQRLRWAALDAFNELVGTTGPDVERIGARLSVGTRRDLADMAKHLSVATQEPRKGTVPAVAVMCAQAARDVAVEQPSLEMAAWSAAEACMALKIYVEGWERRQAGGGA